MGKYLPNTDKYIQIILDETSYIFKKSISSFTKSEKEDEIFRNIIFNLDGPRQLEITHPPQTLFVANTLFRPMSEILSTMDVIENIVIYMRRFPYDKNKISKLGYLKYHIEGFLNEVYILKERLKLYSYLIKKAYGKEYFASDVRDIMKNLMGYVDSALDDIISVRGKHIHRYRYTDQDLDHLSTLELLSKYEKETDDDRQFWERRIFFDNSFKDVRKKKVQLYTKIIGELWKILDKYFGVVLEVVSKIYI